ncbi:MAG TPA: zf-HC2 domain-containing protein [Myxococcales bacterium]|nr:zf-HC2 domain-containing protein [Myxococcales bacterium]
MTEAALEHALLRELVAALADGELPAQEARVVEEHLRGCMPCRRELDLQQEIFRSLAKEPVPEAPAGLRRRIWRVGAKAREPDARRRHRRWAATAAAALLSIGIAFGTALRHRAGEGKAIAGIPLLRDAVADCRRAMARNFPRKADLKAAGEGLEFRVRSLERADLELFSTWRTTLAGSPAAGLAYRWRGTVVVQYAVPAELVRRQPGLDTAPGRAGVYAASDQGESVVAFISGGTGTVLVADAPVEELRDLVL